MKNKSEIAKNIFKGILMTGGIVVASTSPIFASQILPEIYKYAKYKIRNKKNSKKFYDTFYRLKKEDMLFFENRSGQLYISLTPEGKKKAGKYQIDDLEIKKPKKWDGRWRILISDIQNKKRFKREALRGKIKDLGLFQIQKSVWAHPYDFQKEVELLRSFFNLTKDEMKIVVALNIEDDDKIKRHFKLA